MKRSLLIIGVVLIMAAGGWKLIISPRWEQRFSPDWQWKRDTVGATITPGSGIDESMFDAPIENDPPTNSTLVKSILADTISGDQAELQTFYSDVDPLTGEVLFSYTETATVNMVTGKMVGEGISDYLYLYPRNVQQQDYLLYLDAGYYGVQRFEFLEEDTIGGLRVYHFVYQEDVLDETELYVLDGLIAEDETIVCYDIRNDHWVEPVTGEIVKSEEICPREYIIDPETGENIRPEGRWMVRSSGDDVQRRVVEVESMLNTHRWTTLYVPILLAAGGGMLLVAGIFIRQQSQE